MSSVSVKFRETFREIFQTQIVNEILQRHSQGPGETHYHNVGLYVYIHIVTKW